MPLHTIALMRAVRVHRKLASWIGCLAILIAAVAPTIAHALHRGARLSWVEVCSALGPKLVKVDASADPSAPAPIQERQAEHCAYCSLHASSILLPPQVIVATLLLVLLFEVSRISLSGTGPRYAWAAPQSRAPPSPV